ncbi:MAG: Transposase [Candidatus Nitrotoga sp. SPKER]|nr:MAG: Transposase [Candidatus Nitrotoga sp. SPKER]
MARFKPIYKGLKLLPVDFKRQVIPGSFEYALCYLVDHELDLSAFNVRYKNDVDGASAYNPAVLIKIILLAYCRGIISSRKIEAACRENVLFIAVSGDSQPHFTTLAGFVSTMGDTVAKLFAQVLLICDRQGLIGREMFTIDGVKLPANASKAKSGTRADYQHQVEKMELAAKQMLEAPKCRLRPNQRHSGKARSQEVGTPTTGSCASARLAQEVSRRSQRQHSLIQSHRQQISQNGYQQRGDSRLYRCRDSR